MRDEFKKSLDYSLSKGYFNNSEKRDPNRIHRIINLLEKLWETSTDVRFNQLVDNLQHEYKKENGIYTDMFYVEDDKWEEFLKEKLERVTE